MVIERQTIVTWYTPEERMPEEGDSVVVSVSGQRGRHVYYDHAFALAEWYEDSGWLFTEIDMEEFTVHAWCDLEPYAGGEQ